MSDIIKGSETARIHQHDVMKTLGDVIAKHKFYTITEYNPYFVNGKVDLETKVTPLKDFKWAREYFLDGLKTHYYSYQELVSDYKDLIKGWIPSNEELEIIGMKVKPLKKKSNQDLDENFDFKTVEQVERSYLDNFKKYLDEHQLVLRSSFLDFESYISNRKSLTGSIKLANSAMMIQKGINSELQETILSIKNNLYESLKQWAEAKSIRIGYDNWKSGIESKYQQWNPEEDDMISAFRFLPDCHYAYHSTLFKGDPSNSMDDNFQIERQIKTLGLLKLESLFKSDHYTPVFRQFLFYYLITKPQEEFEKMKELSESLKDSNVQ